MSKGRFGWLACGGLGLLLLLLPSCAEPPGAAHIVGPDGTRMLHVHCSSDQVACFQIAGERCPHGYDLSPIFDPHDGNFLVRCRDPQTSPALLARAPSPHPNSSPAPAVNESWPPAEVAKPTEPWPAHVSTDAPPPPPRKANGAVDLGY